MARVYADMILNGKINPATGSAWKIEDVPARIREAVRALIEE